MNVYVINTEDTFSKYQFEIWLSPNTSGNKKITNIVAMLVRIEKKNFSLNLFVINTFNY